MRFIDLREHVAYHAGAEGITTFYPWTHFGTERSARHRGADRRAQQTYRVDLDIKNPLRVTDQHAADEAALLNAIAAGHYDLDVHRARRDGVIAACEDAGYDGLVYQNRMEDVGKDSWVIFHPRQARASLTEGLRKGMAEIGQMTRKVFWNPSPRELKGLLDRAQDNDLRGGAYRNENGQWEIAVWPARALSHWNFFNELYCREGVSLKAGYFGLRIGKDLDYLHAVKDWKNAEFHPRGDMFVGLHASDPSLALPFSDPEFSRLFPETQNAPPA